MFRLVILCLCLYAFTFPANEESLFSYFQRHNVSDLTIISDYVWLTKNKYVDTTLNCTLKWTVDGKELMIKGEISLRGKTRRRICDYPPIKLNLSKKDLKSLGLNGSIDEYKLVQPCKNADGSDELLKRELLAYQLIRLIDTSAFAVHSFQLTLTKKDGAGVIRHPAFLLESEEEIDQRLNLVPVKGVNHAEKITLENRLRLALIQMLVGNDDWDINAQRNVYLLQNAEGNLRPIAYDFDYSGLVAAPYAKPNPNLPPHTLKDRVYMGPKVDQELWIKVKNELLGKRDFLLDYLKSTTTVSADSRREVTAFVRSFFVSIKSNKPPDPNTVFRFADE